MSIIESIIYGFVSGITEFVPVSSRAHQMLLRYIFGEESRNFLQEFLVHIGILMAIFFTCREYLMQLRRQQKASQLSRKREAHSVLYYDLRLLKTAAFPLLIGLCFFLIVANENYKLLTLSGLLIVNAIILLLAVHSQHGNRDARTMSGLDGIIMGVLGSLSAFPGISRMGIISSYTALRGAEHRNSFNWVIVLSIPAIMLLCIFDIVGLFGIGAGTITFIALIGYILSGLAAFGGGYLAISILLSIVNHLSYSHFAYYSIGVSLFSFILYLIT